MCIRDSITLLVGVWCETKYARVNQICHWMSVVGLLICGLLVLTQWNLPMTTDKHQMLISGGLSVFARLVIVVLALVCLLLVRPDAERKLPIEFYFLFSTATLGMILMASTSNLLMAFVALELSSLSLYVLTALEHDRKSAEGSFKYFILGAVASAFMLFGMSYIYGVSGSLSFHGIAQGLEGEHVSMVLLAGMIFVMAGFAFKIASVPFHFWAPDTYQVAPLPVSAFIASASKVAGFILLGRFLLEAGLPKGVAGIGPEGVYGTSGWLIIISVMAVASIIFGNIAAIGQKSFRRLLAYSAIGHAGYLLIGLASGTEEGFVATLYYVTVYAFAVIGAFSIIACEENTDDRIDGLRGLMSQSPIAAMALLVFILSLAGVPPLAGFFAKFYVFVVALHDTRLVFLVVIGLLGSVIAFYYYLAVLKWVFVKDANTDRERKWPLGARISAGICLTVVLIFGLFPSLLLETITLILSR